MPAKSGRGGADVPGVKTNEREGTRAVLRHSRMSAYKVRQVLNLIRGQDVTLAAEILANGDREAATVVGKVLASAVANAVHNDGLDAEELYVSACFADEGSHAEALAAPGPWPGHPHPQADVAHHHHREPHARRADRPPPGQAVRRRRPALAPGGRLAPARRAEDRRRPRPRPPRRPTPAPRRGPRTPSRRTTWSPRRRPARWRSPTWTTTEATTGPTRSRTRPPTATPADETAGDTAEEKG